MTKLKSLLSFLYKAGLTRKFLEYSSSTFELHHYCHCLYPWNQVLIKVQQMPYNVLSLCVIYFSHEFFCSGEKATAECVADAIADNRAELVHLPSTMDLHVPLPSKECPTCDGTVRNIFSSICTFVSGSQGICFSMYSFPFFDSALGIYCSTMS